MYVYRYLSLGHPARCHYPETGFTFYYAKTPSSTSFQMLEAALHQIEELDEAQAQMTLVAAARYLAAHAPTARALRQTANLALRLHRGETSLLKIQMKRSNKGKQNHLAVQNFEAV